MKILEHLKSLKELYLIIVFFIGIIIGSYEGYNQILDNIESNTNAVEITQIMILKTIVRDFESKHKSPVSDQEWEEYILNYSTLFDLKIKHKMLSSKAKWMPIERKL